MNPPPRDDPGTREAAVTDRHAFLSAIRASPADDTARLVFADWLEEQGEELRAELIRLQIMLAMPDHGGAFLCLHEAPCGGCQRVRAVGRQVVDSIARGAGMSLGFSRGILERVECSAAAWLQHGDAVYDRERPWRLVLTSRVIDGDDVSDFFGPAQVAARWPGLEVVLPGVNQ